MCAYTFYRRRLLNTLKSVIHNLFETQKSTNTKFSASKSVFLIKCVFANRCCRIWKQAFWLIPSLLAETLSLKVTHHWMSFGLQKNAKYALIASPVASHLMSCSLYLCRDSLISGYFSITLNSIYSGPHWFTASICGYLLFNCNFEKWSMPH